MTEDEKNEYMSELNKTLIYGLLGLFTVEQLRALQSEFEKIIENRYGEITIIVDGDWLYLKPSLSKRIGRIKRN